ncbi:Regulator of chromosome condensation [Araneus ventricosus]|uniref:Regulator of chromosome condensation n=1 Tax=Araneus ventricosus TaxID=182803 RepID=A0A4Y2G8M3_ARAVE|nr:Regulator of chromosome condensation [Araneus ventricosus]
MVQNSKSKKAKQAEKAHPVNNDSEQPQSVKNAASQNHTENESEMNSVPNVESKINGEQNSVAEPESSSNGVRLAIKSRTKKAAESAAETESTKTTVSERGEGKSTVPQTKTKGRPRKDKNFEMDTVETTGDEPCSSGSTRTKEDEEPSERIVTSRKRKVASPAGESESEEVDETESAEATVPAKKSRRKEVMAKDKKEETEQESAETTEPSKKSRRRGTTAKGKTKEIVEQAEEIEQESVETSEPEPEKKSRKRKTAEPIKAEETKSKKREVKKAVPVTKSKKQKVLLSIPSVKSVSGKVFVMGENDVGQLGFGEEVETKKRPAVLELPYSITSIAAGGMHSVCLTESGEVITFGCNDEGALGRITANGAEEASPGRVEIPEKVIQISAGDSHSSALTESGQVYVWGNFRSGDGPMGLTADGVKQMRPVRILNNIQIVKISSGADHLACLSSDGIVYTCGCGQNGQLGRLTERACPDGGRRGLAALLEPAAVPVKGHPSSRTRAVLIEDIWTSNYSTFLKAQETGLIYAFGLNNYNQLGYENERVAFAPKQVASFNNSQTWKEIAGGQHHTLSLDSDGLVYSMGREDYGRLGLGENCGEKSSPTLIVSLENEKCSNISCGNDVSFAVTEEGSLYSWGMGTNSQLGHGNEDDCLVPRLVEGNFVNSWKALKVSGGGQHTLVLATPKESGKGDNKK